MCRNWKFWAVLVAVAAGVVAFTPVTPSALVPLLVFAACPLMMVLGGAIMYRTARPLDGCRDVAPDEIGESSVEGGWPPALEERLVEDGRDRVEVAG